MTQDRYASKAFKAGVRLGGLLRLDGDPEQIREARMDLNAGRLERAIQDAFAAEEGIRDSDRQTLANMILSGGESVE